MEKKCTLSQMLNELGYQREDAYIQRQLIELADFGSCVGTELFLNRLLEKSKDEPTVTLDATILLVADRLYGEALALHYFIKTRTTASVAGVAMTYGDAVELYQSNKISALVFVGYQKSKANYSIINDARQSSPDFPIVMWAHLDECINVECQNYSIWHSFDRRQQTAHELMAFLRDLIALSQP